MTFPFLRVAIGSDHAGFDLKSFIIEKCELGVSLIDKGSFDKSVVDYPDVAKEVSAAVSRDLDCGGILICGTGIGMSIVANRFSNIRAALCRTEKDAEFARAHNDANILCLAGRDYDEVAIKNICKIFFTKEFDCGRHLDRVRKININHDNFI